MKKPTHDHSGCSPACDYRALKPAHEELVANLRVLLGYKSMAEFWENNKGFRIVVEKSIAKAEGRL